MTYLGKQQRRKGKERRTAKFRAKINTNPEASAPQSYNLGGRTWNSDYDKPNSDSTNKTGEILQENKA